MWSPPKSQRFRARLPACTGVAGVVDTGLIGIDRTDTGTGGTVRTGIIARITDAGGMAGDGCARPGEFSYIDIRPYGEERNHGLATQRTLLQMFYMILPTLS